MSLVHQPLKVIHNIPDPSRPTDEVWKEQHAVTPLPSHLKDWADVEDWLHVDRPIWTAAWKHFAPFLASNGYNIYSSALVKHGNCDITPHEADLYLPPRDPFNPQPNEALVHAVYPYPVKRYFEQEHPVVYAGYDTSKREVFIKLVQSGSELEIIRYLAHPLRRMDPRNHTIPILDIIPYDNDQSFVIMASWGSPRQFAPNNIWEYLDHARQALEGLCFMHEHGVAHRDISDSHILINHRTSNISSNMQILDRKRFDIRLAFIDFGLSTRFPLDTPPTERRVNGGWGTIPHWPPEVEHCTADDLYDPFLADVYSLGSVLRKYFNNNQNTRRLHAKLGATVVQFPVEDAVEQHLPEFLDILALMVAKEPAQRPTAAEALSKVLALLDADEETLLLPRGSGSKIDHSERLADWMTRLDS